MSSNERAFFIPLASARYVRALKKRRSKKRAGKTGKGGKEKRKTKTKIGEKARLSGVEKLGACNGIRGIVRVPEWGWENGVRVAHDWNRWPYHRPGPTKFSPGPNYGDAASLTTRTGTRHKDRYRVEIEPDEHEFNGWNLIWRNHIWEFFRSRRFLACRLTHEDRGELNWTGMDVRSASGM